MLPVPAFPCLWAEERVFSCGRCSTRVDGAVAVSWAAQPGTWGRMPHTKSGPDRAAGCGPGPDPAMFRSALSQTGRGGRTARNYWNRGRARGTWPPSERRARRPGGSPPGLGTGLYPGTNSVRSELYNSLVSTSWLSSLSFYNSWYGSWTSCHISRYMTCR
jgi:hypothetical protein